MAKNKNKNKNNNNKQQPQVKPIPTVVMKAVEELTSEEREELKAKGEAEKTQLIQEGQAEKERLIGEGEAEKKKIIDRAAKEAQKSVDEIQRQYIDEVREEAVEEANAEKEKIIAEATAIKDDVAAKQEEVDAKLTEIEKQYEDLASKMEQVTKDSAELETKKKAYKVDALQEVSDQIKEFNSTINTLEEEKIQLEKKLKQKEQELASCNEDKDCYLEKLNESGVRKQELMKLEYEIESLKKRNETLEELYNKCKEEKDKYYNQVEKFGQNPSDLIDECNRLEEQNKTLQNRLANVPTNDEIARLRKIDEEFEKTIAELLKLKTEKIETDRKLADLDIYSKLYKGAIPILKWIGADEYYKCTFRNSNFPADVAHKERNFRIAETVAMCMEAGIEFRPYMLPKLQLERRIKIIPDYPVIYLSKELKQIGQSDMNEET